MHCSFGLIFFFFKQKTAYEMRISDWSSDVCSSDLSILAENETPYRRRREVGNADLPMPKLLLQKAAKDLLTLSSCVGRQPADVSHVGLERRQLTVVLGDAPSPGDGIFRAKHVEKMCESRPEFVRQAADRIWTIEDRKMLAEKPTAHSLVEGIERKPNRR